MAAPQLTPTPIASARRSPSGADLVLLLLFILVGFGIWAVVERLVAEYLLHPQPSEERVMDARGVTKQKAELADLQNEASEIQKYLNAARLDQIKQHAAVESLVAANPQLNNSASANGSATDTVRAYLEAKRQEQVADGVVSALEHRLSDLKQSVAEVSASLSTTKEAADTELRRANFWYGLRKKGLTFVITLAIVVALLTAARAVLWKLAKKKRMSTAEGFRPFVFALAALVVLFAYDQFSYAGAALVGIILLLWWLRRINWPSKSGVLAE